ncbi:GNAT family N-acetyltransferase [Saccharothrix violaceirubra]|uniref:Ribosomal protein S18 acetylase RimI-like enzyme n=1 Tax=Saccharothrix violaceirubra TaxID=413306 RepID=A0A7W7WW83_9PSEU|nr:GNAT family N-acetyltransferase [Saccharothrix violaceirubra]MBB4966124.1 ribosomal protein S18 acetylase RimI-like enzyme [Saccharothrix violaceirubra]
MASSSPLDHAAWESLHGGHARFAQWHGQVVRYDPEVAPFLALPPESDADVWRDVAEFAGPGGVVSVNLAAFSAPADWEIVEDIEGVQLVDDGVVPEPFPEAVRLGPADVPEIIDLVERTRPGPFRKRTIELGTYLGVRDNGRLVALAGERMNPPGWREISAVCTDPAYRGRGLATRLVLAVAAGIRERGETPLMHALASNVNAIRLYESLGFRLRRRSRIVAVRVPHAAVA